MNRLFKGFAVVALVGAVLAPQVAAQTLMTPGVVYDVLFTGVDTDGDGFFDAATTTDSFLLPGTSAMEIWYTDCCLPGDSYQLFADGVSLGLTPVSPPFGPTLFTAQGGQVITIEMPVFGGGLPAGSSIYTVTPEPGTILLMATGLLGLGVAMRRRNDEDEV